MKQARTFGRRSSQCGAVLVFALVAMIIMAVFVLGMMTFTTQHYTLTYVQRDMAASMDMAEGAMYWEINKMARWEYGESVTIDNRYSGRYAGVYPAIVGTGGPSSATGGVEVYVTAADGVSLWIPPANFHIYAGGFVRPPGSSAAVRRQIQAEGAAVGAGDLYALYGVSQLILAGRNVAISSSDPDTCIGSAGRCSVTVAGSAALRGTMIFDSWEDVPGRWSGGVPGWDWIRSAKNCFLPTVREIAARAIYKLNGVTAADPIAWLRSNNDNEAWIRARTPAGKLVSLKWKDKTGKDLPRNQITPALYEGNTPNDIVLLGNPAVLSGGFQRGSDFYLERLEIPDGRTLEIQNGYEAGDKTSYGPVRLWLNGGPGSLFDLTRGKVVVHYGDKTIGAKANARDRNGFALYNAGRAGLRLGGNNLSLYTYDFKKGNYSVSPGFSGLLYAFNADSGGFYGDIEIAGDLQTRSAIIGWNVIQSAGDLSIALDPVDLPTDPALFVLFYRIRKPWFEPEKTTGMGAEEFNRWSAAPGNR